MGPPKSGLPHGKCVNRKGLILSNTCVTGDYADTNRTVPKCFRYFFSPAFLLFGNLSLYVKISTEGCRIRLRKNLAFANFSTFWTCFWVIFVIYISRIIKNFVGAFDKMEKYKKLPIFWYITSVKTLHFKGLMADSMLRTHPFPHFVKKKKKNCGGEPNSSFWVLFGLARK